MNLIGLIEKAKQEMKNSGLADWTFSLSTSLKNAGECDLKNKIISINSIWAKTEPADKVYLVLAEEIEHAQMCPSCSKKRTCVKNNHHCEKLTKCNKGGI